MEKVKEREDNRIKQLAIEKGGGVSLELSTVLALLPGMLHTPETLFTQQPRRGLGPNSYLLRAWATIRC